MTKSPLLRFKFEYWNMKRFLTLAAVTLLTSLSMLAEPARLANLVVFVRFADEKKGSWAHSRDYYEKMFNDDAADANSVRRFFLDMSYGNFDWQSTFSEVEYQDSHNRNYFKAASYDNDEGYGSMEASLGLDLRFKTLIKDMCEFLEDKLPEDVELDLNNDGEIDNIVIIISGKSEYKSSDMLWPMNNRGSAGTLRGLKAGNFLRVFDQANGYKSMVPQPLNTGVLCHEMTHTLNAYDLYTSSSNKLEPVNIWDLMSDNQTVPQSFTAYTRSAYGKAYGDWLPKENIPLLEEKGEYTLLPVNSTKKGNVAFRIVPDSKKDEYFMVEYRDNSDKWDASLPNSGLLVYRVNPKIQGNLGANFEVYVFRPGGSAADPGTIEKAPLGPDTKRYSFGTEKDTDYPFYSDGSRTPFSISGVRKSAGKLYFTYEPLSGGSAVDEIAADPNAEEVIYTLQGIRIKEVTAPGVYIVNGKKRYIRP